MYDVTKDPFFSDGVVADAPQRVASRVLTIFTHPRYWTKNAWARNAEGARVSSSDRRAVCFCLQGAVERAHRDLGFSFRDLDRVCLAFDIVTRGMTDFNDRPETTFEDVISAVKEVRDGQKH